MLVVGCVAAPPPTSDDVTLTTVEPLTPAQGLSVHIEPFVVPPGTEEQDCHFFTFPDLNGDGSDVWIDRFKIGLKPGSHHLNVFRVKTIVALDGADGDVVRNDECFRSPNWADWPLVVNSQDSTPDRPVVDWQLPAGVAQRFSPGEKLMLQVHYVNATTQVTPGMGEARVNFYRTTVESPIEMGTLFATQQNIRVCKSTPTVSFSGSCAFPDGTPVHVVAANGHFHARGQRFRMYAWDGISADAPAADTEFYESTTWAEPPMTTGLDVAIPSGGGVLWTCDFQWSEPSVGCNAVNAKDPRQQDDCCYTFGPKVELNEHCNAFVYYWPKVARTDITCF